MELLIFCNLTFEYLKRIKIHYITKLEFEFTIAMFSRKKKIGLNSKVFDSDFLTYVKVYNNK